MIDGLQHNKLLVIVESPAKASVLSTLLKELGYTKVTVGATLGYVMKIKDRNDSFSNTGIYPNESFRSVWEIDPNKYSVIKKLEDLAKSADFVIFAFDPTREGESLSKHLVETFNLPCDKYFRLHYSSMTKDGISDAMTKLSKLNYRLAAAADVRQMIDKLIGYTISSVAKAYVGTKSVGRCQSACLKLVVDREKEIQTFMPSVKYSLGLKFSKSGINYIAKYIDAADENEQLIETIDEVDAVKEQCVGKDYTVVEVRHTVRHESPCPPFNTATLQQEATKAMHVNVGELMQLAQKLFEQGLITYHITNSTNISKSFRDHLKYFIKEQYSDIISEASVKSSYKADSTAGEGIRVIDICVDPKSIAEKLEDRHLVTLYTIIWKRTVAAFLPPAQFKDITYIIKNDKHLFKIKTSSLEKVGYRILLNKQANVQEAIDIFKEAEVIENVKLVHNLTCTHPPKRFSESDLIKALYASGVGRPSTIAPTLKALLYSGHGYCAIEHDQICPTDAGIQLSNYLDREFSSIINVEYSSYLEVMLDAIASGRYKWLDLISLFYSDLCQALAANKETVSKTMMLGEAPLCPNCSSPMVLRRSKFGKLFYGCSEYPKCRGLRNID